MQLFTNLESQGKVTVTRKNGWHSSQWGSLIYRTGREVRTPFDDGFANMSKRETPKTADGWRSCVAVSSLAQVFTRFCRHFVSSYHRTYNFFRILTVQVC